MKKRLLFIGGIVMVLCALVVVGVLLISNRTVTFEQALKNAGIRDSAVYVYTQVQHDHNGDPCKVIQSAMTETGTPVLAIVSQQEDGSWEVTKTKEAMGGFAKMGWISERQSSVYDSQANVVAEMLTSEHTWNYVYHGNNAVKKIELDDADIPNNVAVSIVQQNKEYWIYVVSYSDSADSSFNIYGLLQEGGFIPKS